VQLISAWKSKHIHPSKFIEHMQYIHAGACVTFRKTAKTAPNSSSSRTTNWPFESRYLAPSELPLYTLGQAKLEVQEPTYINLYLCRNRAPASWLLQTGCVLPCPEIIMDDLLKRWACYQFPLMCSACKFHHLEDVQVAYPVTTEENDFFIYTNPW
jgi:hypothetical protein